MSQVASASTSEKKKQVVDKRPWTEEEIKKLVAGYELYHSRIQNDIFRAIHTNMGLDRNVKSMQSKMSRLLKTAQGSKVDLTRFDGIEFSSDSVIEEKSTAPQDDEESSDDGSASSEKKGRKRKRLNKTDLPEEVLQKLITLREREEEEEVTEVSSQNTTLKHLTELKALSGTEETEGKKQKRMQQNMLLNIQGLPPAASPEKPKGVQRFYAMADRWEHSMDRWEANQERYSQKQELLLDKMMVFFGITEPKESNVVEVEEDKQKEQ